LKNLENQTYTALNQLQTKKRILLSGWFMVCFPVRSIDNIIYLTNIIIQYNGISIQSP